MRTKFPSGMKMALLASGTIVRVVTSRHDHMWTCGGRGNSNRTIVSTISFHPVQLAEKFTNILPLLENIFWKQKSD